jgi:hypothetical protein
VLTTSEYQIDRLSFVRDPGLIRPRYGLARSGAYFADRYRLRIPEWELDLVSEPLVAAPAHLFPIEYWSGPTRVAGTIGEQPVHGLGFHERTWVFTRDFELVDVLRQSLRHLPPEALGPGAAPPLALANLAWEVDAFLSHGGRAAARAHLIERLQPHVARLAAPYRAHLQTIVDDLLAALR